MNRFAVSAGGLFFLATLAGCGNGMASVQGTVSLDGQPVKSGAIEFVSLDDKTIAPQGGLIVDGSFKARMRPGNYTIILTGNRVTGSRKQKGFDGKEETVEETEPLFPEQFNTKSELKETIKAGSNTITLDLKSKK
jgi:hypothetical protein